MTKERQEELNDLQHVLGTVQGRRFIWKQLGDLGIFTSSFVSGSADITAFNEGARNKGLILLAEIMSNFPGSFLIMQKEAIQDEENKRNKRRKKVEPDPGSGDTDD